MTGVKEHPLIMDSGTSARDLVPSETSDEVLEI